MRGGGLAAGRRLRRQRPVGPPPAVPANFAADGRVAAAEHGADFGARATSLNAERNFFALLMG